MFREPHIPLLDLVSCLSDAVDLVSHHVDNHHKQVASIAFAIASEASVPMVERNNICLAALVHDVGALSLNDRVATLNFETSDRTTHSSAGWMLLQGFQPFSEIAPLVRYHHRRWDESVPEGSTEEVLLGSNVIHLADRVAVQIDEAENVLDQVEGIIQRIRQRAGTMFAPRAVDAFLTSAAKEHFWLDAVSPDVYKDLEYLTPGATVLAGLDPLHDLARVFARIIDFRSRFTATHSRGVAVVAEKLASLVGMSHNECRVVRIAGHLHDLGKLAVPSEILEKPGPLNELERNVVRSHTYYTYRLLKRIDPFVQLSSAAAFHHEKLDGTGYPFHLSGDRLHLSHRIMAVADVFVALTEDRPYRDSMGRNQVGSVLESMARSSALDAQIVSLAARRYDELDAVRQEVQVETARQYSEFRRVMNSQSAGQSEPAG